MKPIKFLPILLFLFCFSHANAQYFPDSLVSTGVQTIPSISPGFTFFARYYRDSVTFDSMNGNGEFYTVEKRIEGIGFTRSKFNLRVDNKKVYLSGTVNYGQPIVLNNLMVYDYNHVVGDTFTVKLSGDTLLDIHFKVDSIKLEMYRDGISRMTHYYKVNQYGRINNKVFFSPEGLGSSLGMVYLKIDNSNIPVWQDELISICKPAMMVYGNEDCVIGSSTPGYRIVPVCREDSVIHMVTEANRTDVDKQTIQSGFNLYPNPVTDRLQVVAKNKGFLSIMDYTGKVFMENIKVEEGIQVIDVSLLKAGVYLLVVQPDNGMAGLRIILVKEN